MRSLDIFHHPENLTGGHCRRLRLRWDIHVHHLADAARVDRATIQRWELGRWHKATPGWLVAVCTALRSLVLEAALVTAMMLADPADERLASFKLLAKGRRRDGAGQFEAASRVVLA